jgi:hypothetical protein
MTLQEWFIAQEKKGSIGYVERLATLVGESPDLVRSWSNGRVLPTMLQRQMVAKVTKGAVGTGDWK